MPRICLRRASTCLSFRLSWVMSVY
jgi:hypothetical protein